MCTLLYTNQVMWSYIVGMLTNLGKLPLDRILMMLKMFAMQGSTSSHDCTPAELKVFLDKKVKEQQLTCSGGLYQLNKSGTWCGSWVTWNYTSVITDCLQPQTLKALLFQH